MTVISKHFMQVYECMTLLDKEEVERAVAVLDIVRGLGKRVWLFGNGGSHATASHWANDLTKMAKCRASCVGDATPTMTAYGNDNGWENMFADPLLHLAEADDAVIGISCSGNSENVLVALRAANGRGCLTIGLTGNELDSRIHSVGCDVVVHAPFPDIRVQEDVHLIVAHAISRALM